MFKLKKIGTLSLGFVQAVFGLVIGIIVAVVNWAVWLYVSGKPELLAMLESLGVSPTFSYTSFLVIPALYALIGFVLGLITAAIYNYAVVPITKGLSISLEK